MYTRFNMSTYVLAHMWRDMDVRQVEEIVKQLKIGRCPGGSHVTHSPKLSLHIGFILV